MSRNLPYNRADRVAKQIYHITASYIYEDTDDDRLTGIQLTRAAMTNDLSIARIYYYVPGGKDRQDMVKLALNALKAELRNHIGREIVLKTLPRIEFYVDEGIENAERIEGLLSGLKHEE